MTNDPHPDLDPQIIGMPWFEAESFYSVKALMHDADRLHARYAQWEAAAKLGEQTLRLAGKLVFRVPLDGIRFPAWCAAHRPNLHLNAQARMDYAAFVAAQMYRASQ